MYFQTKFFQQWLINSAAALAKTLYFICFDVLLSVDETGGRIPLLITYIYKEKRESSYTKPQETKKETKKIREITKGCL